MADQTFRVEVIEERYVTYTVDAENPADAESIIRQHYADRSEDIVSEEPGGLICVLEVRPEQEETS